MEAQNGHARILGLRTENVLKLGVVNLDPDPHWNGIGGPNNAGKTSLLDSIRMAFGGAAFTPTEPVRHGANRAETVIDVDLDDDGKPDIQVIWKCTATGKPSLTVTNTEGAKFPSPQSMLSKLIDRFGFDLTEFLRAKPVEQQDKYLAALGVTVDDLDQQIAETKRDAQPVRAALDSAKKRRAAMIWPATTPEEPVDVSALMQQAEAIREWDRRDTTLKLAEKELADLQERENNRTELDAAIQHAETLEARVAELQRHLTAAQADLRECRDDITRLKTVVPTPDTLNAAHESLREAKTAWEELDTPSGDLNTINNEIANAGTINEHVRTRQQARELDTEITVKESTLKTCKQHVSALEEEKLKRLTDAQGAVPGMTIGTDGLRLYDVPFDQVGQREQLSTALNIGRAANPNMTLAFIEQGAYFDRESRATLRQLAEERGLQVWFETVDDNESVTILMEEGQIKEQRTGAA